MAKVELFKVKTEIPIQFNSKNPNSIHLNYSEMSWRVPIQAFEAPGYDRIGVDKTVEDLVSCTSTDTTSV